MDERNKQIIAEWNSGGTLESIGVRHNLRREAVRKVLMTRLGECGYRKSREKSLAKRRENRWTPIIKKIETMRKRGLTWAEVSAAMGYLGDGANKVYRAHHDHS